MCVDIEQLRNFCETVIREYGAYFGYELARSRDMYVSEADLWDIVERIIAWITEQQAQ